MEVFKVKIDSNVYQQFLPDNQTVLARDVLKLDCVKKGHDWKPLDVHVQNPKLKQGNFYNLCVGGFVIDSGGLKSVRTILEMAGELLPVTCQGTEYYLLNILECVNCLNDEQSEWAIGKTTGAKTRIKKHEFFKDRFSESSLFKIPETCRGDIFTVAGLKDPEDEFKTLVEIEGLTGLVFQKVWSSTEGGIFREWH